MLKEGQYSIKKNFFDSKASTEFLLDRPSPDVNRLTRNIFELVLRPIIEVYSGERVLINVQGQSSSGEIMLIQGERIKLNQDNIAIPFNMSLTGKYFGKKNRKEYLTRLFLHVDGILIPNEEIITTLLETILEAKFIQKCTLNFEFLYPHFFSWIGLAPTIEDAIELVIDKSLLKVLATGQNIENTENYPIKNKNFWISLTNALKV